jgi:hypothetical protein
MTDEARIAQLTEGMVFTRKPPLSPADKAKYAALEASCGEAARTLQKLRLRLWHATQGDYRSLPLAEARAMLEEVKETIDSALAHCPRNDGA